MYTYRCLLHVKLTLPTCRVVSLRVEAHHLDGFVVGSGGYKVAGGVPCHAVDGAFVVFTALEHHLSLTCLVILSVTQQKFSWG